MSTLHTAYLAAVEAARIAAQAWMDDDSATQEDLTHPARIATDAADAVRDAARDAWLKSDEPREWGLYEDGDCYATHWGTLEEAMAAARCNIDAANYEVTQTIWIDYRVVCSRSPRRGPIHAARLTPATHRVRRHARHRQHRWRCERGA